MESKVWRFILNRQLNESSNFGEVFYKKGNQMYFTLEQTSIPTLSYAFLNIVINFMGSEWWDVLNYIITLTFDDESL